MQALEADPHDATDHQEEEGTGTHLVEQEIDALEAALNEELTNDSEDSEIATHLISSAFSTSAVESPTPRPAFRIGGSSR